MQFLQQLFDTSGFPPRWQCGSWTSGHGWLHILSDLGVWSAYVAIPCVLGYFFLRRKDLPFRRIFLLFGAFILACGTTHFLEAVIFWWPAYRLAGVIKLVTALVSWATVFALIPIVPKALAMRSAEALEREVEARKAAEVALQRTNDDLERRIARRTADLVCANAALEKEVAVRRQAEERVQRIADAVPALISYVGPDGHYQFNNCAYESWFGRPRADFVGLHLRDALGESTWQTLRPHIETALAGEAVSYELEMPYLRGGRRWMDVSYTPDRDENGVVRGLVVLVNDATAHKRVQAALQESELQLREWAAQLAEADRRKDEFLALLSHELRNPLASIRNGLEVMRLAADDCQAVQEARATMGRQLGHLVHLVDDLLDVGRITHGKLELRRVRTDLTTIVETALEFSRLVVEEAGHALTVSLPSEPVYLDADVTRMAQSFANLLNNAARYTPRGGRIAVQAQRQDESVVVTVSDTGIGIPDEALGSIFDMFSQVDQSLERPTGGLGIGLALVKALIEMHGGTVQAFSAGPNEGSEFVVTLPVAPESAPLVNARAEVRRSNGSQRVLVVDDNRDGANSLTKLLQVLGHEVDTSYDGLDALTVAAQTRPDLVLLDIGMPKMNGHEVCRRLREQPWGRSVTVVALTGWSDEQTRSQATEAGFDGHLTKPVEFAALAEWLERISTDGESKAS
ncbi:MAG: response regulator [Planctomycetota bacterium]